MADLALQRLPAGGVVTMTAAAGGGDTVPSGVYAGGWDVAVVLVVRNAHTSTWNVTVAGQGPVTVAANGGVAVIPVRGFKFGDRKAVTYSGVTALTVGVASLTNKTRDVTF